MKSEKNSEGESQFHDFLYCPVLQPNATDVGIMWCRVGFQNWLVESHDDWSCLIGQHFLLSTRVTDGTARTALNDCLFGAYGMR